MLSALGPAVRRRAGPKTGKGRLSLMAEALASVVNLNTPDHYLHWGFILISLANLFVIVAMVALFVLALVVPFVHARRKGSDGRAGDLPVEAGVAEEEDRLAKRSPASGEDLTLWTARARRLWLRRLPPDKLLPDGQPAYVASWIYVFGVLTLAGLVIAIVTGAVLALEGPVWWHSSSVGLFVNSLHLWSVECFMAFMAIHLWGKFWMAAWRGRRALTWMTGVVAFLISVFEAFTGYLSQTNFDSQWISFEAKDAMNSAGIGAFFNTMNFGQALMLHIVFVPLVLVAIVGIHILMVRLRGVSHPIDARREHLDLGETVQGVALAGGDAQHVALGQPGGSSEAEA
jgi:quinol-cytochrome oxidoreductase complex cytochrome b subunit